MPPVTAESSEAKPASTRLWPLASYQEPGSGDEMPTPLMPEPLTAKGRKK